MTAGGNSLTIYMPRRSPPEDGGISIQAVEQRLIAMLEELDREFGRSWATPQSGNDKDTGRISRGAKGARAQSPACDPKGHQAAEARTALFIATVGALAGLWFGLAAWSRAPVAPEATIVRADAEKHQHGVTTAMDQRSAASAPAPAAAPRVSAAEQPEAAGKAQQNAPPVDAVTDGLTVDEFHTQVRRLMSGRQLKAYDAGLSGGWPSGALLPNDTAPSLPDEPQPIAPPSTATSAVSALEMATADETVETDPFARHAERAQKKRMLAVSKLQAKSAAGVAKPASQKQVVKRPKAAAREPAQPADASNGAFALFQGAAETFSGAVKEWGRITRPAR